MLQAYFILIGLIGLIVVIELIVALTVTVDARVTVLSSTFFQPGS